MEFQLSTSLLFGAACAVTSIFLAVSVFRKLRRIFPVNVNCWFCNGNSKVPYSLRNTWTCTFCHQYNGFAQDGGYNKRIPAQFIESLNHPIRGRPLGNAKFGPNGLCTQCNLNQELKIFQISSFVPTSEADFDNQVIAEQRRLEKIYALCRRCQEFVRRKLNNEKENDEADLLIEKLKIGPALMLELQPPLPPPPSPPPPLRPLFSPLRPYNSSSQLYSPGFCSSSSSFCSYPLKHSDFSYHRPGPSIRPNFIPLRTFPQTFYSSSHWDYPVNYYRSSSVGSIFGGRNKNLISPPRLFSRSSSQSSGFFDGQSILSEPLMRDISDDEENEGEIEEEENNSQLTIRRTVGKKKNEKKRKEFGRGLLYFSLLFNLFLLFLLFHKNLYELQICRLLDFLQETIFDFLAPDSSKYLEEHVLWNVTQ